MPNVDQNTFSCGVEKMKQLLGHLHKNSLKAKSIVLHRLLNPYYEAVYNVAMRPLALEKKGETLCWR